MVILTKFDSYFMVAHLNRWHIIVLLAKKTCVFVDMIHYFY